MLKYSCDLIAMAKNALAKMLKKCIKNGIEPSYLQMYYEGYKDGLHDSERVLFDNSWHYIELEGCPYNDEKCWCLIQADGYQDVGLGCYDIDKKRWYCEYWNESYDRVIAWHALPTIND